MRVISGSCASSCSLSGSPADARWLMDMTLVCVESSAARAVYSSRGFAVRHSRVELKNGECDPGIAIADQRCPCRSELSTGR